MPQGRPQLFKRSHQVSVLVSNDDFKALNELVARARREQPTYSFGDLLRSYIRRGLEQETLPKRLPSASPDPRDDPFRQLHALARRVHRLAQEIEARNGHS